MVRSSFFPQRLSFRKLRLSIPVIVSERKYSKSLLVILLLLVSVLMVAQQGFCAEPPKTPVRKMTVADAVFVALTNNVTLRSAYLDRYLQRITLQEAERQYYLPSDPRLILNVSRDSNVTPPTNSTDSIRTDSLTGTGTFTATLAIPTGGTIDFAWNNNGNRPDLDQAVNNYSSDWSVTFRQPLLKGGGLTNAAYNVRIARINEEGNILALKDTIAGTISAAVKAFRSYKAAERQLVIAEMGLVRAKALYEYNKDMIEAGRMAGTEIVQTQADIATQETALIDANNTLDNARLTLIQTLYIDKNTTFQAVDENQQLVLAPDPEEALALAFQYRKDYLNAIQNLESIKLRLAKAKRNMFWRPDFIAETTDGSATTFDSYDPAFKGAFGYPRERNWSIGLQLEIPIVYYMTSDIKNYLTTKNDLEKANMAFEKLKLDVEINVKNAVRNVDSSYRSLKSATLARELSEKKLQIEKEKLGAGRTTNFQFVSFQRDLQTAQKSESDAMTAYLNSLTDLDTTLGTTLITWKIDVSKKDDQIKQTSVTKEIQPSKP